MTLGWRVITRQKGGLPDGTPFTFSNFFKPVEKLKASGFTSFGSFCNKVRTKIVSTMSMEKKQNNMSPPQWALCPIISGVKPDYLLFCYFFSRHLIGKTLNCYCQLFFSFTSLLLSFFILQWTNRIQRVSRQALTLTFSRKAFNGKIRRVCF